MVDTFHSPAFFGHSQTILVGWCRMMLAYKVHKPIWKEDWGMSKLLKRVVVRYGDSIGWWSPDSTRNYTVYD